MKRSFAKIGDSVIFKGQNGYTTDVPDALKAGLTVGSTYTVSNVDIGNWCSYYKLEGFHTLFNTVMFDVVHND